MKDKILYVSFLMALFLANPMESNAQCHIKDVIMGTVPEDENPDDERYFWTKTADDVRQDVAKGSPMEYAPHTLILSYDNEKGKKTMLKAIKKRKCSVLYDYNIINGVAIKVPENWNLDDAIRYFKTVKGVVSVNKDRVMHIN